jgi:hypothetical protein
MLRHLLAMIMATAAVAAAGQTGDTTVSAACRDALDALQAQEAKALAARGGASQTQPAAPEAGVAAPPAILTALRERAARVCLGGSADAQAPRRGAQAPVAVPPVTPTPSPGTRFVPVPAPAPAPSLPSRSDQLLTVTGCDPSGCWASDGSRLNRVGSNLVGPHGVCTLQGPLLRCQ